MEFYDALAEQYDEMTRFTERIASERKTLQKWIDRYGFRSALDVACGTGLHAIILTQLGVATIGVDRSAAMLDQARRQAEDLGVIIPWIHAPMQALASQITTPSQALFCLGNSLPHILAPTELDVTIPNFYDCLTEGGVLVIQLLNYARVLAQQQRIVAIHRNAETVYVRFYDFQAETVQFNVLTIHFQGATSTHHLHSTPLKPYTKADLEPVLTQHGFINLEYFGDMQFHPFEEATSGNLVIAARKRLKSC